MIAVNSRRSTATAGLDRRGMIANARSHHALATLSRHIHGGDHDGGRARQPGRGDNILSRLTMLPTQRRRLGTVSRLRVTAEGGVERASGRCDRKSPNPRRAPAAPTLPTREARVPGLVQAIGQQVQAEHREGDRQAGEGGEPPGPAHELLRVIEQRPPAHHVAVAQTEEAQAGLDQDRAADAERRLGDDRRQRAGEDVPNQARSASTCPRSSRAVLGQKVSPSRRMMRPMWLPSSATAISTRKKRGTTWNNSARRISPSSRRPPA